MSEEQNKRNFYKTDYDAVIEALEKYDWGKLLNSSFQNDYSRFFGILDDIMENYTPFKTPKKKRKNLYMTKESMKLRDKKIHLWNKFLSTRSNYDRNNYIRCKNRFRSLSRKLRREFELNISTDMKEKPKLFWSYANSRLKTKKQISFFNQVRWIDGNTCI